MGWDRNFSWNSVMQAKSPTPNYLNHHLLPLGVCISKKLRPGTDRRESRDLIQDVTVIFVYDLCILYLERQSVRETDRKILFSGNFIHSNNYCWSWVRNFHLNLPYVYLNHLPLLFQEH